MTPDEMSRHGISACAYRFEGNKDIRVEWRGTAMWAVVQGGANLNRDGEWEHEPLPSNRDHAFFERCRFTLDEALRRAVSLGS